MTGTNTDLYHVRGIFARIWWLITLVWIELFTSFERQIGKRDTFKIPCKNYEGSNRNGDAVTNHAQAPFTETNPSVYTSQRRCEDRHMWYRGL